MNDEYRDCRQEVPNACFAATEIRLDSDTAVAMRLAVATLPWGRCSRVTIHDGMIVVAEFYDVRCP